MQQTAQKLQKKTIAHLVALRLSIVALSVLRQGAIKHGGGLSADSYHILF